MYRRRERQTISVLIGNHNIRRFDDIALYIEASHSPHGRDAVGVTAQRGVEIWPVM